MSNKGIYSFNREGGWNSSYSFHYESAWLSFFEYEETINILFSEEKRLKNEFNLPKHERDSLIYNETRHLHEKAYRLSTSAHLYVCMAIEGFINYYGTKRIGEELYKPILERIGITEKLSLLYLVCFEEQLLPSNTLIKEIRKIFDQRNALVHPKTKELTSENMANYIYIHPSELEINNALKVLEIFISNICNMDAGINRDFHFKKPNKTFKSTPESGEV